MVNELSDQINELSDQINELKNMLEKQKEDMNKQKMNFDATIMNLTKNINKSFGKINKRFAMQNNHRMELYLKIGNHFSQRFDDVESRLEKIEADMNIVRQDVNYVSNWTKIAEEMFDITRTHAYEIPEIETRVKKIEDDKENQTDSFTEK